MKACCLTFILQPLILDRVIPPLLIPETTNRPSLPLVKGFLLHVLPGRCW